MSDNPEPRPLTVEDIHRNQRANLALRALDLETELVLAQEEIARLKARIDQLTGASPGKGSEVVKHNGHATENV